MSFEITYPEKLKVGDEIRIVTPSNSMLNVFKSQIKSAKNLLEDLGFIVSFSKNAFEKNKYNNSSSVKSRVEDLHEAFSDQNVKMILPVIGGYHSNQLLDHLDWRLIKQNAKIVGGYSDTTALQNSILAKTSICTYSTIAFIMLAKVINNQYSIDSLLECVTKNEAYEIKSPDKWDDSEWYIEQNYYKMYDSVEHVCLNSGLVQGMIIGGNLGTLRLLQGTQYFPTQDRDFIYFIEECAPSTGVDFARELQSLIHASNINRLKGLVIGRFQIGSKINEYMLKDIIEQIPQIKDLPIITNVAFGHTYPIASFPIGGTAQINTDTKSVRILKH